MIDPGFEIYVAPFEAVCQACGQDRLDDLRRGNVTKNLLGFPQPFTASQIVQLGKAVSLTTGIDAEFGTDENRREPQSCVFVDRLDARWVEAAAGLGRGDLEQIQVQWVTACSNDEGERPAWADDNHAALIERFIELCHIATSAKTDLVMVWIL